MTKREHKERMTVTVDPALVRAGNQAVKAGLSASLSAWVNAALVEQVARDVQRKALEHAIEAYEAEFGVITPEEMRTQLAADRRNARRVRRRSA